jgi:hypothetical protein
MNRLFCCQLNANHGSDDHRSRFGCAIGAIPFLTSGMGFHLQRPMLSFLPVLLIIPLASIAALRNGANWGSYGGLGPKYNSCLLDGLPIDSFVDTMSLDP